MNVEQVIAEIHQAVRDAVRADNRPQMRIAEAVGMHEVNLSQYLSGARAIDIETLSRLAEVVGLEFDLRVIGPGRPRGPKFDAAFGGEKRRRPRPDES